MLILFRPTTVDGCATRQAGPEEEVFVELPMGAHAIWDGHVHRKQGAKATRTLLRFVDRSCMDVSDVSHTLILIDGELNSSVYLWISWRITARQAPLPELWQPELLPSGLHETNNTFHLKPSWISRSFKHVRYPL